MRWRKKDPPELAMRCRFAEAMKAMSGKLAKQAGDVRATMKRNSEILIEGQLPAGILLPVSE